MGSSRVCYPCGLENLIKVVKRDDERAYTRKFLQGNLIFTGDDYTWLKAIEDGANSCVYIIATLERSCDNQITWSTYFEGKFTTIDGKWDLDRCRFDVELSPNDIYACIENGSGKQFNILTIPTEYTINDPGVLYSYEWAIVRSSSTCVGIQSGGPIVGGTDWTWVGCDSTTDAPHNYGFWWREYKWTPCIAGAPVPPDGAGWSLDTDNCATSGLAKYVRTPIETAPNPATDFYFVNACTMGIPQRPVGTSCNVELMDYDCGIAWAWYWDRCPSAGTDYTHNRLLYDVVKAIAQEACADIVDIKSDFFEWNPPGDAPGYVAGTNYVSGDTPNKPNQLYISQKSDILDPTATQPATLGKMTWSEITAWLYNMFQVRWWYDAVDSNIRFEHVSYNQFATGPDYTVGIYATMLKGKNIYTYNKDKRYKYEKFKAMEQNGLDFIGKDIIYDLDCIDPLAGQGKGNNSPIQVAGINENSITYSVDKITTDLEYIVSNPSDIAKDGFVMICAIDDGMGNLSVDYELGAISGNTKANGHLAWANLHDKYWRHNRILIEGNMNGNDETFITAKRTKRQSDIVIFECCDAELNTEELVKTELGFGLIDEYKVALLSNKLTMTIDL